MPFQNPQSQKTTNAFSQLLHWNYLGQIPYEKAWELQKELREHRIADEIPDTLLLLEHPPTITLGKNRGEASLQVPPTLLQKRGVSLIRSDRGGDATFHGPGQLVGYLIFDIEQARLSLPQFVEKIAQVFIDFLAEFGISAHFDLDFPGVWVGPQKIVAFGFHLRKGVTMHGFAFNVSTELSFFDLIIPCGLKEKGVASLASLQPTSRATPQSIAPLIAEKLAHSFQKKLERDIQLLPSQ